MLYIKPVLKSYSAVDIIEEIGPCQNQYTTILYTAIGNSSVNVDGFVTTGGANPTTVSTAIHLSAGENSMPAQYDRSFVGFDISNLTGHTIVSAILRMYQVDNPYTNPYNDGLGNVVVDHVNFGTSLDTGDTDPTIYASSIAILSNNPTVEWKTLDVTTYVQNDLNSSRTSSQFRIRFETTINGPPRQSTSFESAENSFLTNNKPELVVIYQ